MSLVQFPNNESLCSCSIELCPYFYSLVVLTGRESKHSKLTVSAQLDALFDAITGPYSHKTKQLLHPCAEYRWSFPMTTQITSTHQNSGITSTQRIFQVFDFAIVCLLSGVLLPPTCKIFLQWTISSGLPTGQSLRLINKWLIKKNPTLISDLHLYSQLPVNETRYFLNPV